MDCAVARPPVPINSAPDCSPPALSRSHSSRCRPAQQQTGPPPTMWAHPPTALSPASSSPPSADASKQTPDQAPPTAAAAAAAAAAASAPSPASSSSSKTDDASQLESVSSETTADVEIVQSPLQHKSDPAIHFDPDVFETRTVLKVSSLAEILTLVKNGDAAVLGKQVAYDITPMDLPDVIELVAKFLTMVTTANDWSAESSSSEASLVERLKNNSTVVKPAVLAFHGRTVPSIGILQYLLRIQKYCPCSAEVYVGIVVYFYRMADRINAALAYENAARASRQAAAASLSPSDRQRSQEQDMLAADPSSTAITSSSSPSPSSVTALADLCITPAPLIAEDPSVDGLTQSNDNLGVESYFILNSFNIHRLIISAVTSASKFFSDVFFTNSRYAKVGGLSGRELNKLELQFLSLNDFRLTITMPQMLRYSTMLVEYYIGEHLRETEAAA